MMKSAKKLTILLLLASAGLTQAQTLLLNFGNETIANWNKLGILNADLSSGSVINDTGSVMTGVSITTDNFVNTLTNSGTYPGDLGPAPSWMLTSAVTTTWIRSGGTGPGTVVISGLNNSFTYSLDVVSARSSSNPNQGVFTANSAASNIGNSAGFLGYASGWVDGQALTWNSLTPIGGTITLNVNGIDSGNTAYINALRLTAIPEPASVLLAVAGVGVVFFLRRKGLAHRTDAA